MLFIAEVPGWALWWIGLREGSCRRELAARGGEVGEEWRRTGFDLVRSGVVEWMGSVLRWAFEW